MRARIPLVLVAAGAFLVGSAQQTQAWRGGGFGGFHAGGFGGATSFHSGGFGGGFGSVHYSGASHYGPATGFTHVGGATYSGAGGTAHYSSATHTGYGGTEHYSGGTYSGAAGTAHYGEAGAYGAGGYSERSVNYGSIQHYDANARVAGPYGAAVYHGPEGGTAAAYRGPYSSGAAVKGPAGYGAAAVKGPAGGTAAAYRGPYGSGAVAHLPSGYTTTAWHGTTYYHSGYSFYQPAWYAGTLSYVPVAPPVGYFFDSLPPAATPTVINNSTYYVADGAYYQPSTQNGQQGYAVVAAPPQAAAPQQSPPPANAAPDPLALLRTMSDFMGQQPRIRMVVSENFDEVVLGGQKITLGNRRLIQLSRPDKISISVDSTTIRRRLVYDGSNFTAIDLLKNVYATIPLQGSLDSAMDELAQQYGLAQPVEDLLYSNLYDRLASKLQSGQFLGQEKVIDSTCNHLAFKQPGVSWQIWIEAGNQPAPRKLVITYDTTPGRPQYTLLITMFETPDTIPEGEFKANLPAGAVQATLLTLAGQTAGQSPP